jgi:hypothetical protein
MSEPIQAETWQRVQRPEGRVVQSSEALLELLRVISERVSGSELPLVPQPDPLRGVAKASQPSPIYKRFVERCLRDKGYEPLGWE